MKVSRYIAVILFAALFLCSDHSNAVAGDFGLNDDRSSGSSTYSSGYDEYAPHSDKVTIDYLQNKKPAVSMSHHNKYECRTCHHKRGSYFCSSCHKAREESRHDPAEALAGGRSGNAAPPALFNEKGTKNIFHSLCRDCHKEKDQGPRKCKNCHRR